jgi:hypothetical protein
MLDPPFKGMVLMISYVEQRQRSDLENTMFALVGISFSEMPHKFLHSATHSLNTLRKSKEVFTCHVTSFSDWTFKFFL